MRQLFHVCVNCFMYASIVSCMRQLFHVPSLRAAMPDETFYSGVPLPIHRERRAMRSALALFELSRSSLAGPAKP